MSAASMFGQSIALGTTVGEGEIYFSDGTVQTTAYNPSNITVDYLTVNETATINTLNTTGTATINTLNTTGTATINTLDVSETATIETAYIGSNSSTSGLVVYGNVSQVLSSTQSTQFGSNSLPSNTGPNNTAVGYNCMANNTSGGYNTGMGDYALTTNSTGYYNTGIGHFSQIYGTGGFNTAVGASSLQGTTG